MKVSFVRMTGLAVLVAVLGVSAMAQGSGVVTGVVTDELKGSPLQGANVTLEATALHTLKVSQKHSTSKRKPST